MTHLAMYDPVNKVQFSDVSEIHTLELKKIPKDSDGTILWDWMYFLSASQEEEFEMIAEKNPSVNKKVLPGGMILK